LKWNFYNTEERKAAYLESIQEGDFSGKGIGYWWKKKEFESLAQQLNLTYVIEDQEKHISTYRSNLLFFK
jgi:hypothetical protein